MTIYQWSTTALNNQTADPTINWREGQAPSSVNDSARAMMAAMAAFLQDINGVNALSGGPSAYTLNTNQGTGGTPPMGFTLAFRPMVTNNASPTLAVDGGSAYPIRYADGQNLPAGFFNPNAVYQATYMIGLEWLLFNIPAFGVGISTVQTGAVEDYLGTSAPPGYVMASGQPIGNASSGALERANADTWPLYNLLWSSIPTLTVNGGRGASAWADFNANKYMYLPDFRGRVTVGRDAMGTSGAAGIITNFSGTTLGAIGGEQNHALTANENGPHNHSASDSGHAHPYTSGYIWSSILDSGGAREWVKLQSSSTGTGHANITVGWSGNGQAHNNLQPSIIVNKIIKL